VSQQDNKSHDNNAVNRDRRKKNKKKKKKKKGNPKKKGKLQFYEVMTVPALTRKVSTATLHLVRRFKKALM
jgi:hypothetical protein